MEPIHILFYRRAVDDHKTPLAKRGCFRASASERPAAVIGATP